MTLENKAGLEKLMRDLHDVSVSEEDAKAIMNAPDGKMIRLEDDRYTFPWQPERCEVDKENAGDKWYMSRVDDPHDFSPMVMEFDEEASRSDPTLAKLVESTMGHLGILQNLAEGVTGESASLVKDETILDEQKADDEADIPIVRDSS